MQAEKNEEVPTTYYNHSLRASGYAQHLCIQSWTWHLGHRLLQWRFSSTMDRTVNLAPQMRRELCLNRGC